MEFSIISKTLQKASKKQELLIFWEVLPKVKKGLFWKYFLKSKRVIGKYFLKSKKVILGSTSYSQKRSFWEVLPKVKKGHLGKYFLKSKRVISGSTS